MADTNGSLDTLVSLVEAAADAAVQRSLVQTLVPTYRQGTVTEVDTVQWIHRVQLDGDVDTVQVHDGTEHGAFVGARVTVLFAPPHQGRIIAVNRRQVAWQRWDVDWDANGSAPAINDGTLIGAYQRRGFAVDFNLWLLFGPTTSGGTLGWSFNLPLPAAADVGEQVVLCKAFTTGGANWSGFAFIAAGSQQLVPFFPFNTGVSFQGQAQNADGTGAAGTGIPLVSGQFSWTNGANFNVSGSYKVAA